MRRISSGEPDGKDLHGVKKKISHREYRAGDRNLHGEHGYTGQEDCPEPSAGWRGCAISSASRKLRSTVGSTSVEQVLSAWQVPFCCELDFSRTFFVRLKPDPQGEWRVAPVTRGRKILLNLLLDGAGAPVTVHQSASRRHLSGVGSTSVEQVLSAWQVPFRGGFDFSRTGSVGLADPFPAVGSTLVEHFCVPLSRTHRESSRCAPVLSV